MFVLCCWTYLVQRPRGVPGHGKVGVEGQVHDVLGGGARVGRRLDPAEALADEEDAVDEQAVGGALDLKVAEEGVGAEQGQGLVQDVVALRLGVGRLVGGQRRVGWDGEGVGGPARLGAQRQEGEVANQPRGVWVGVEDGVVGLYLKKTRGEEGWSVLFAILRRGVGAGGNTYRHCDLGDATGQVLGGLRFGSCASCASCAVWDDQPSTMLSSLAIKVVA